jgi:hypothetical protein
MMSDMRAIIEKLTAIMEERPAQGDGIFLEFSDKLEVETKIVEITESGDIIVLGDDRFMRVMESLELMEAEYHGRKVPLNKPMKGDVKKSKVYVKDPKTGNVKKVNFGDKNMRIKKSIPGRRKNFRARHHCENPGPKTKARYWSCRAW